MDHRTRTELAVALRSLGLNHTTIDRIVGPLRDLAEADAIGHLVAAREAVRDGVLGRRFKHVKAEIVGAMARALA